MFIIVVHMVNFFSPVFPGLTMHATILAHLFSLVETGKVSEPLFSSTEGTQYSSNQVCVFIHATAESLF